MNYSQVLIQKINNLESDKFIAGPYFFTLNDNIKLDKKYGEEVYSAKNEFYFTLKRNLSKNTLTKVKFIFYDRTLKYVLRSESFFLYDLEKQFSAISFFKGKYFPDNPEQNNYYFYVKIKFGVGVVFPAIYGDYVVLKKDLKWDFSIWCLKKKINLECHNENIEKINNDELDKFFDLESFLLPQ